MMGFTLQKYFQRPQDILNHTVQSCGYKPLKCMKEGCEKDIISKENIPRSLAGFYIDDEGLTHLIYGCKSCVDEVYGCKSCLDEVYDFDSDISRVCPHYSWAEIEQIRYIEQMLNWRLIVDEVAIQNKPAADFYKHWALLQEAILQIQVPQGWGRWI